MILQPSLYNQSFIYIARKCILVFMSDHFNKKKTFIDYSWDIFCAASILGIWPRYIEPKLLLTTKIHLRIDRLPPELSGLKILQISDLHLNEKMTTPFLKKIIRRTRELQPDIIVLTGDFLCFSELNDPERMLNFLNQFNAPYGCYTVLGNHDYDSPISVNPLGEYDQMKKHSNLKRAFTRLFSTTKLKKSVTEQAKNTPFHHELLGLLKKSPFRLLHNETISIKIKNSILNVTGLGEYTAGKINPEAAFTNYDSNAPGIILLHNPDGLPLIKNYPGEIVLCGHTHGGQINLPWLWRKFTLLENMTFKKGLFNYFSKWVYVSRGIGSSMQFRLLSPPEITLFTL